MVFRLHSELNQLLLQQSGNVICDLISLSISTVYSITRPHPVNPSVMNHFEVGCVFYHFLSVVPFFRPDLFLIIIQSPSGYQLQKYFSMSHVFFIIGVYFPLKAAFPNRQLTIWGKEKQFSREAMHFKRVVLWKVGNHKRPRIISEFPLSLRCGYPEVMHRVKCQHIVTHAVQRPAIQRTQMISMFRSLTLI